MLLRLSLILLLSAITAGCTSQRQSSYGATDGIIIDTQGVDMSYYRADLADCQRYSSEVRVAERAATSAAGGAVVGGVIGAIVGDSGTAGKGAGVGAVTGAIRGVSAGGAERERVVKTCLRGRGYRVLN